MTKSWVKLLAVVAFHGACSSGPYEHGPHHYGIDVQLNGGLSPPTCREERPRPRSYRNRRQHVCWKYGEPTDRALSASCRIDMRGRVECWRDSLSQIPLGSFSSIDDDGFNACTLDSDGRAVCWGTARRGWHVVPRDKRFLTVRVGGDVSPLHMGHAYACGLTVDSQIVCWEEGSGGSVFSLPGEYQAMDTGNNTVCGLTRAGAMHCLESAQNFTQRQPPNGTFAALAVGTRGVHCVLDAANRAHCWISSLLADPPVMVENVSMVRAGRGHACIVGIDGVIKCIGDARPPPNLRVMYLTRPAGVSDNYCAIGIEGTRYCWGDPDPEP